MVGETIQIYGVQITGKCMWVLILGPFMHAPSQNSPPLSLKILL